MFFHLSKNFAPVCKFVPENMTGLFSWRVRNRFLEMGNFSSLLVEGSDFLRGGVNGIYSCFLGSRMRRFLKW